MTLFADVPAKIAVKVDKGGAASSHRASKPSQRSHKGGADGGGGEGSAAAHNAQRSQRASSAKHRVVSEGFVIGAEKIFITKSSANVASACATSPAGPSTGGLDDGHTGHATESNVGSSSLPSDGLVVGHVVCADTAPTGPGAGLTGLKLAKKADRLLISRSILF